MAPRWRMASWISAVPTARAVCAEIASVKRSTRVPQHRTGRSLAQRGRLQFGRP